MKTNGGCIKRKQGKNVREADFIKGTPSDIGALGALNRYMCRHDLCISHHT